jgi:hypothetical protein
MPRPTTQIKLTVDAEAAAAFKAWCASEGISMASAAGQWMKGLLLPKRAAAKLGTRPHRRKAVRKTIALLEDLLQREEQYRDAIPEEFQSRHEAADQSCELLAEAISCLEDAY